MAKSNLLVDNKVYCPHCKVPIGQLNGNVLPVGFVSLSGKMPTTVICNDCQNSFTYRPPQLPADNRNQPPPQGLSQPL